MRFQDFIRTLNNRIKAKSQQLFAAQIISALCGEADPIGANNPKKDMYSKYSKHLPDGLNSPDDTMRKALFYKNSTGLSGPTRAHILDNKNMVTFLAYCETVVDARAFDDLCGDFGVTESVERSVLFQAIYTQFLAFASTGKNEAPDDFVERYIANPTNEDDTSDPKNDMPLYAGDGFRLLRATRNLPETTKIYEKINYSWVIKNSGKVPWKGRYMEIVNFDQTSLRIGDGEKRTIEIKETPPGGEVAMFATIEMRSKAGYKELILDMMDKDGRLCFPDGCARLKFSITVELGIEL